MIPFNVRGKRILLLQGPMGPFFRRLADGLLLAGARCVHKVNFNGGDRFYFPTGLDYTGSTEHFGDFLQMQLHKHNYDMVCLFGDCRPHHLIARKICDSQGTVVMVFEEGYLRPHFITVESGGANGNSSISYDMNSQLPRREKKSVIPPKQKRLRTRPWAWWHSFCYGLFLRLHRNEYPNYKHHRALDLEEGLRWVSWEIQKYRCKKSDKTTLARYLNWVGDRYFVPLQLANDCQVTHHSPFASVEEFIGEVIREFRQNAAPDAVLLFKHHPLDPYNDYANSIKLLSRDYGVSDRVLYALNGHLPTILNCSTGVITINSTVGISALIHRRPLCVRGAAVYGLDGLVTRDLSQFMKQPWAFVPDRDLVENFRNYHLATTQAAGSFYRKFYKETTTGLIWPNEANFESNRAHSPAPKRQPKQQGVLAPLNV